MMNSSVPKQEKISGSIEFSLRLWCKRFEQQDKNIVSKFSTTELLILHAVSQGYTFQSRIAPLLSLTPATISQSVAKLLNSGYLRQAEGQDRRFRTLELTSEAQQFLTVRTNMQNRNREHFFADLSNEELNELFSLLRRLSGLA